MILFNEGEESGFFFILASVFSIKLSPKKIGRLSPPRDEPIYELLRERELIEKIEKIRVQTTYPHYLDFREPQLQIEPK